MYVRLFNPAVVIKAQIRRKVALSCHQEVTELSRWRTLEADYEIELVYFGLNEFNLTNELFWRASHTKISSSCTAVGTCTVRMYIEPSGYCPTDSRM